jgi:hypothetical protein
LEVRVLPRSVERLRDKLRAAFREGRGRSIAHTIKDLIPILRGWIEAYSGNEIGWIDPRAQDEHGKVLSPRALDRRANMLAWPERFPARQVKDFEYELGPYAFAGQYQQSPEPRKGGIFKREYWHERQ